MLCKRSYQVGVAQFPMTDYRLNAYHIMWIFIMFDLPTVTKKDKKVAARFRKDLERDGFIMHQFSVYARYCGSLESARVHIKRVKSFLPVQGSVSILMVTDKQYSEIINYTGGAEEKMRHIPVQLELF